MGGIPKHRKYRTLKQILLRSSLLYFLLPLLVFWMVLLASSLRAIQENALRDQVSLTQLMSSAVEKELDRMEQDLKQISMESKIQEILREKDFTDYGSELMEDFQYLDHYFAVMKNDGKTKIDTIYLVTSRNMVYTSEYVPAEQKKAQVLQTWAPRLDGSKGKSVVIGAMTNEKGVRQLIVGKLILDNKLYRFTGAVFISYQLDSVIETLQVQRNNPASQTLLLDKEFHTIYTDAPAKPDLINLLYENQEALQRDGIAELGRQTAIYCPAGEGLSLSVVNLLTPSTVSLPILLEQGAILLLGVACIILFALTMLYTYRKLFRPIQRITHIKQEQSPALQPEYECYELNQISDAITSLIKKTVDGEEQVIRLIDRCETVTIDKLQAQINPHFLYNTLTTIKYKAALNQQEEISRMISSLVKLLRSTINRDGNLISLREEIENVGHYIYIENAAYHGNISFSVEIPESLMECPVPNFILQPLIENSIFHGIHPTEPGGKIAVKGFVRERALCLQVRDNGDGFGEDSPLDMLGGGASMENHLTGIGLKSIHQKIQLLCGSSYGLKIYSQRERGTLVELLLPLREDKEETVRGGKEDSCDPGADC